MELKNMKHLVTKIKRYLRVYWHLVKFSAMTETTYRFGFFLEMFVETAYIIASVLSIRVLYWNIQEIAGWDVNEMLVLMGVNALFSEIVLGLFFIHNLRNLPGKIMLGELDLVLTKPLNSQFSVSMWRPYFALVPSCIPGIALIFWGFARGNLPFNLINLLPFALLFVFGGIIAYSIGMLISTLTMWFINAHPIPQIAENILFMAKVPLSVYNGFWKILFLTVIPIVFMVSLPSSALLGDIRWFWIPTSLLIAIVFIKSSNIFWNFALKKYTSASS